MLHKVMTSTSEVRICCGDAVGTLSLTSGRVSCQGVPLLLAFVI